jgi:hypothetical protein
LAATNNRQAVSSGVVAIAAGNVQAADCADDSVAVET